MLHCTLKAQVQFTTLVSECCVWFSEAPFGGIWRQIPGRKAIISWDKVNMSELKNETSAPTPSTRLKAAELDRSSSPVWFSQGHICSTEITVVSTGIKGNIIRTACQWVFTLLQTHWHTDNLESRAWSKNKQTKTNRNYRTGGLPVARGLILVRPVIPITCSEIILDFTLDCTIWSCI